MNSWNRFKVIEKIRFAADELGASNPQQKKQLIFSCRNAPETEVYFGLFSFFFDSTLQENNYARQKLAGSILLNVVPPSPLALDASVYASTQYWNLSVEELPWYWCRIFGQPAVETFLAELVGSCADTKLKRSVKTLLSWCRCYE